MPKQGSSKIDLLRKWVKLSKYLVTDDTVIFCQLCNKKIPSDKKFQLVQHLNTYSHKRFEECNKPSTSKQQLLPTINCSLRNEDFEKDLCEMLVSTNIPLKKISHPSFRGFLEKYTKMTIPCESTLRQKYLNRTYDDTMHKIKSKIKDQYVWFSVDETTDTCGRYIANLVVGVLNENIAPVPYLVRVKQLEKTNNCTIARFVNEGLNNLYLPEPLPADKIVLMLTDSAAYMLKAAQTLKILYPNLIHLTCFAHGVNRIAETVRGEFPNVNSLIKTGKKVFLKSPCRIQHYKENLPNTPLPIEPVVTRWGTWLNAVKFYADHYEQFKMIVLDFDPESARCVKECQNVLKNDAIKNEVIFIKTHYSIVAETILQLEQSGLTVCKSLNLIHVLKDALGKVPGTIGNNVFKKFESVFSRNPGYDLMCNVGKVLNGELNVNVDVEAIILAKMKYCPVTSVDVERTFSTFKHILSDRRHNFLVDNLEKHVIVYSFFNTSTK